MLYGFFNLKHAPFASKTVSHCLAAILRGTQCSAWKLGVHQLCAANPQRGSPKAA